jgi:hypothetical protein
MENENIEWIKKSLIDIFEEKCVQIEENYKNFKTLKKELKNEYCVLNENRKFCINFSRKAYFREK